MAELKTKATDASVAAFLDAIVDEQKRQAAFTVMALMCEVTGSEGKMWGNAIVGFGDTHYKYASGRENDWFLTGFSPRKQNLTLYITGGFEAHGDLLAKLGKHKISGGCLHINKLKDVDLATLRELIQRSVVQQTTPTA